ncbi:MAG: hypothetical protein KAV82_09290 [Phycisphaerae bacterium]|nr:hypothetical protein [Phycisphaerae bacterium]
MTRRNHTVVFNGLSALLVLAIPSGSALAELKLRVHLLQDRQIREEIRASRSATLEQIAIGLGTPIAIRVELLNDGKEKSAKLVPSLRPEAGAHEIIVVASGRQETRITARRWERRRYGVVPRQLEPRESLVFETWLFGRLHEKQIDTRAVLADSYIFPEPGIYEVYSRFTVRPFMYSRDPADFEDLTVIESNRVRVQVGAPIAGWEELKSAGIVRAIEAGIGAGPKATAQLQKFEAVLKENPNPYLNAWLEDTKRQLEKSSSKGKAK